MRMLPVSGAWTGLWLGRILVGERCVRDQRDMRLIDDRIDESIRSGARRTDCAKATWLLQLGDTST
jgi:hypothetical protein